jgi:uncharacterized ferritin-like protein (DUF455 family)
MIASDKPLKVIRGVPLYADPAREPCFTVVGTDAEMHEWPDMSDISRRERLHRHMNNECVAMEIASQALVDFPDAPWDLRMAIARQAADESRHIAILMKRLIELGGVKGEFPVSNYEWNLCGMVENLPGRLAIENRTFEAGLIDILGRLRTTWRDAGDHQTADALEAILADEITHVRFANQWIRRFTEEQPRVLLQVAQAIRFLRGVNAAVAATPGELNAVGMPLDGERLAPPAVYVDGRIEAGFTEEEVLEVLKQAGFRSILPAHLK